YLVSVIEHGPQTIWHATELERGHPERRGIVGSQATSLPGRRWVSRGVASQAASYYLEHRQRDPRLVWQSDPGVVRTDDADISVTETWFAQRGFGLQVLPDAEGVIWASLTRLETGEVFWPRYGQGASIESAAQSARERYELEQGA
ncbi:MAG: hypothetical protein ACRDGI_10200, partial [Candidatus Limnocylindrales bacterium]